MDPGHKGITILMRHGHTDYLQGNVPVRIADANDLNRRGIEEVSASSAEIAGILKDSNDLTVFTSPMGRAIHTAKLLEQHLAGTKRAVQIVCAIELQEVHNFSWELFSESVRRAGLDALAHPTDHWFALDPFKDKSDTVLSRLPPSLRDFAAHLETAEAAGRRLLDFMNSTADIECDKVFVTHDGLLCGLLRKLTGDTLFSCTRSHYFEVLPSETFPCMKIGRNNLGYSDNR